MPKVRKRSKLPEVEKESALDSFHHHHDHDHTRGVCSQKMLIIVLTLTFA